MATLRDSLMDSNQKEFWEDDRSAAAPVRRKKRSSIKSMLVFTSVAAAAAVCIAQLVRGIQSGGEGTAVGQFAILNAAMPTLFLVAAYWFFKIFGRFMD